MLFCIIIAPIGHSVCVPFETCDALCCWYQDFTFYRKSLIIRILISAIVTSQSSPSNGTSVLLLPRLFVPTRPEKRSEIFPKWLLYLRLRASSKQKEIQFVGYTPFPTLRFKSWISTFFNINSFIHYNKLGRLIVGGREQPLNWWYFCQMHLFPSIKLDCENVNNLFHYVFCLFIHYSPINRNTIKLKCNWLCITNHITIPVFRCVLVFSKWIVNSIKRLFDVWLLCLIASGAQMLFLFPFKVTVLTAMGEEAIVAIKNQLKRDWEWGFRGCSWTSGLGQLLQR